MEYVWSDLRERIIKESGDRPYDAQEAAVLAVFGHSPAAVTAAAENILLAYHAGRVRAVWPVLAKQVQTVKARPDGDGVVSDADERRDALARASKWVRNAGVHFDRLSEVEEHLYGTDDMPIDTPPTPDAQARFRAWRNDKEFREQIAELWLEQRPRGERAEQEAQERAERYAQWRQAQLLLKKASVKDL